jgi:hypothetical protein
VAKRAGCTRGEKRQTGARETGAGKKVSTSRYNKAPRDRTGEEVKRILKGRTEDDSIVRRIPNLQLQPTAIVKSMANKTKKTSGLSKTLEPFACGGLAATFASIVIHPIDLAKVRLYS